MLLRKRIGEYAIKITKIFLNILLVISKIQTLVRIIIHLVVYSGNYDI